MKDPIGIFDSGIGGLTVVKELIKLLPDENLIYFGDTARIPYGTKSRRLIQQYALEDAYFLLQYNIKLLVVACNSASSLALSVLQERLDIPVIGVVIPGAQAAVDLSINKRIGVIGTTATINSGAYSAQIKRLAPDAKIIGQPCPLLVPLVEEGWLDDYVTQLTLKEYLHDMMKENIDTLILGCTHYPLLEPVIRKVVGSEKHLIDSGRETAKAVKEVLMKEDMLNLKGKTAQNKFFVSDIQEKFAEVGSRFLGQPLQNIERIDFEQFLIQLGVNVPCAENLGKE